MHLKIKLLNPVNSKMIFSKYFIQHLSTKPLSNVFGLDRGVPIDRYYIESFLYKNRYLINGDVLEIADSFYTKKFGDDKVNNSFVFSNEKAPGVDFVGDLVSGTGVKENIVDAFIMTQTLPFIFDMNAAVKNAIKMIRPGGHLLITVSGITPISGRGGLRRAADPRHAHGAKLPFGVPPHRSHRSGVAQAHARVRSEG